MKFKILNRLKKDDGVTNTVSFIVIMFFIMVLLVSFIDIGLYFNVKNQMQSAAESGARSVALYGGVNTIVRDVRGGDIGPEDVALNSIPDKYKNATGNKTVDLQSVKCHPQSGNIYAGDLVYCDIDYKYNGIAGKFSLFNIGKMENDEASNTTVRGSSVSEVTIR